MSGIYVFEIPLVNEQISSGARSKEPACQCRRQESQVQSLGQEDPLEKSMATHSPGKYSCLENPLERGA